eukprot:11163146-Lingulodinium_polyedra.AAC.1
MAPTATVLGLDHSKTRGCVRKGGRWRPPKRDAQSNSGRARDNGWRRSRITLSRARAQAMKQNRATLCMHERS